MKLYRRLLGYVRPYRAIFGLSTVGMLLVASTDVMMLRIVQPILNEFGTVGTEATLYLPLLVVGVFVLRGIGSYISEYGLAWIGSRVVFDLRCEASDHLLRMPTSFYDATSAGFLLSKVTFDAQQVAAAASEAVTVSIRNTLTIAFMLAYLLYINWQLTLIAFVAFPFVALTIRQINKRLRRVTGLVQDRMAALTHVLEEAIGAHRVVKVFGGEKYESDRLRAASNRLRLAMAKQSAAAALGTPINQIIVSFAVGVILWVAVRQSTDRNYGAGDFVAYVLALLNLLNQLKTLSNVAATVQRGLTAAASVFALIDEPPEVDTGTVDLGRVRGEIRFEHVTKRYDSEAPPALSDVDLVIAPGESVALVGPSGGGKTTLVNLIPHFYAPTEGRLLLDGRDLATVHLKELRRQIALVSQDIVLFNDTIAANIAYGMMAGAPREAIERAAEAANALGFIRAQPEGFDTVVGERGIRLSGGQRQRIAIARAILKDAPILILDEATSALDTESERLIQTALETLMRGRTTIVIAHRLSTIEHCDRIIVLAQGRIVEQGTHAELLARAGTYARLAQHQFRESAA
ncbi:MAG TPA: lipid A export permease/ATP-binding protein MsbA [Casimicrobiaceae bacterium]|nr:lipid A export permease/ATP-binding protein MsbA [Casimicrobiaceae bacterium]